jgi:hypothetical protein
MGIDWKSLSDEQILVADKIIAEAERQGIDPQLALSIGYLESSFNPNPPTAKDPRTGKATSATGPMQLTTGAAKDAGIKDRHDVDENIKGGVTYIKQGLEKYNDPYLAALRYKEGDDVVQSYLESKDASVIPDTGIQYWDRLSTHYTAPAKTGVPVAGKEDEEDYRTTSPSKEKLTLEDETFLQQVTPGAIVGAPAGVAQWRFNKQLEDKMNQAKEAELKLKAPTVPTTEESQLKINPLTGKTYGGDRYAQGVGGPGGETMDEALLNREIQKKTLPGEKVTRTSIILPVGSQEEIRRHEAEQQKIQQQQQQAQAEEDAKLRNRIGRGALDLFKNLKYSPVTNVAGGIGLGINAKEAMKRYKEGDPLGAGISGLSGAFNLGALIPLTPNPITSGIKGASLIGSAVMTPLDIAYRKYRASNPVKTPKKED